MVAADCRKAWGEDDPVNDYLKSEEAREVMLHHYEHMRRRIAEDAELIKKIGYYVSTASYCLWMMA